MNTQQILQNYSSIFKIDTIFGRGIRELGWIIIKLLSFIVDQVGGVADKLFKIDTFYNNQNVTNYINSFKPLIIVLFSLSFCIIGYEIMYKKKEYRQIAINLIVAIVIIIILPAAMDKFADITSKGVSAVKDTPQNTVNQILKNNITDLLYLDQNNFSALGNSIPLNSIRYIDPTDTIQPDLFNSLEIKNQDIFKKKISLSRNGSITTTDLNQGWLTFWKQYYYRYSIDFFTIIIALSIVAFTLILTSIKLVILIYELAFNKLLALLVAPADINNGDKTKKVIENIISIYLVTFFVAVSLKFYVLFIGVAGHTSGIEWLIMMIGGSFATIKGPDIIQKLYGIDVGTFKDGLGAIVGTAIAGKTISSLSKKAGNVIKKATSVGSMMSGTRGGTAAGVVKGGSENNNDLYKDMKNKNKNDNKAEGIYSNGRSNKDNKGIYEDKNSKSDKDQVNSIPSDDKDNNIEDNKSNENEGIYANDNAEANKEDDSTNLKDGKQNNNGIYANNSTVSNEKNIPGVIESKKSNNGIYANDNAEANKEDNSTNLKNGKQNSNGIYANNSTASNEKSIPGVIENKESDNGIYTSDNNASNLDDISKSTIGNNVQADRTNKEISMPNNKATETPHKIYKENSTENAREHINTQFSENGDGVLKATVGNTSSNKVQANNANTSTRNKINKERSPYGNKE